MHIQKLLALISVGSIFCAGSLQAQSADNDIQAKAREALRQKMADLNAPKTPANSPVPVVPAAPSASPTPTAPTTPIYTPPPTTPIVSATPVAPVVEAPPTVAPARRQRLTPEQQQQLLEALRQKKAELDSQDQATTTQAAAMKSAPPQMGAAVTAYPALTPMPAPAPLTTSQSAPQYPAPPTMLSGSKEQRLADLLQLYKSDRITPAEYHLQRAKIIAGSQ